MLLRLSRSYHGRKVGAARSDRGMKWSKRRPPITASREDRGGWELTSNWSMKGGSFLAITTRAMSVNTLDAPNRDSCLLLCSIGGKEEEIGKVMPICPGCTVQRSRPHRGLDGPALHEVLHRILLRLAEPEQWEQELFLALCSELLWGSWIRGIRRVMLTVLST